MAKKTLSRSARVGPSETRRASIERLHLALSAMQAGTKPRGRARALTAAAASATVTFASSNGNHLIQITPTGGSSAAAKGAVGVSLPSGRRTIVAWQIQGNGAFTLTASGGTLDGPITSTAPDSGVVGVTVP